MRQSTPHSFQFFSLCFITKWVSFDIFDYLSPLLSIKILECWSIFLNSDIEPCRIKIKVNNFYYKTQFSTAAIFVHGKTVNNKIKKFVHFLFWFFNIALIELLTSLFKYWTKLNISICCYIPTYVHQKYFSTKMLRRKQERNLRHKVFLVHKVP